MLLLLPDFALSDTSNYYYWYIVFIINRIRMQ